MVKQLYGLWGVPLSLGMHQALEEAKKEHEAYKTVHQYRNPSLQELGLSLADIEARYKHYIKTVRVAVSHNPQGTGGRSGGAFCVDVCFPVVRICIVTPSPSSPTATTDKHPPPVLPASLTRGVSLLSSISSPPSTSPLPPEGASENGDTEDDAEEEDNDEDSMEAIGVEEKSGSGPESGSLLLVKKALRAGGGKAKAASTDTSSSSSSSAGSSPRMAEVAAAAGDS